MNHEIISVQPPICQRRSLFRQEEGPQLQQLTASQSVTWLENKSSAQSQNPRVNRSAYCIDNKVKFGNHSRCAYRVSANVHALTPLWCVARSTYSPLSLSSSPWAPTSLITR